MSASPATLCDTMTCSGCNGDKIENNIRVVGANTDLSKYSKLNLTRAVSYGEIDLTPAICSSCKGDKYVKAHSAGRYKTPGALRTAQTKRTGEVCHLCDGFGQTITIGLESDCYDCSGNGLVPVYRPGAVFAKRPGYKEPKVSNPPLMVWSDCDNLDRSVQKDFAARINITAYERDLNTAESLLGMGCLWSCTDYGTMYERLLNTSKGFATILSEIEAEIRVKLAADRTQWCKIIHPDSNVMTSTIGIQIGRNGYAIKAMF